MRITYKDISLYRKEIMGLAILFIMIGHNTMDFPGIFHSANGALKMLTQVGVDLFFFLSGYGCYYSMNNNPNLLVFYRKRVLRIVPAYIIAVSVFGLYFVGITGEPLMDYVWKYSLVSFYKDALLNEWFIAAIMLVYMVFPFLYFVVKNHGVIVKIFLVVLYIIIAAFAKGYIIFSSNFAIVFGIFVTRIPAFLIGAFFARDTIEGKLLNLTITKVINIVGILLCGYFLYIYHIEKFHYWTIIRTLFIFTLLAIIFIWVTLRKTTDDKNVLMKRFVRFLCNIGGYTLEIYLVHEKFLSLISNYAFRYIHLNNYLVLLIANILAFVISIIVAKYLNMLVGGGIKFFENR